MGSRAELPFALFEMAALKAELRIVPLRYPALAKLIYAPIPIPQLSTPAVPISLKALAISTMEKPSIHAEGSHSRDLKTRLPVYKAAAARYPFYCLARGVYRIYNQTKPLLAASIYN